MTDDTALTRRDPAQVASPTEPGPEVKGAIPALLEAAVACYGDVVQALLCDLQVSGSDLTDLSWLSNTPVLLDRELRYQAAVGQLEWWDRFLSTLPAPPVLSDLQVKERRLHQQLRARAVLQAREQALLDHQAQLALELQEEGLLDEDGVLQATEEDQLERVTALARIAEAPEPGEWRVDAQERVAAALAALPETPKAVPITAADLDPQQHFAGFTAVEAMRRNPELAPRAVALDAAISRVLQEHMGLDARTAAAQAPLFTGIFWIALRRALQVGSHQLAVAIKFVGHTEESRVQEQFTRELLESWLHALETLPPPKAGLMQRLLGWRKKAPELPPPPTRPQLTADDDE